jgi:hypothetical protein
MPTWDPRLTPWRWVILEKLPVAQVLEISQHLMEIEGSLACLQKPATGPCLEADQSSPYPPFFLPKHYSDLQTFWWRYRHTATATVDQQRLVQIRPPSTEKFVWPIALRICQGKRNWLNNNFSRSQWPSGLRQEIFPPAQTLGSWAAIPLKRWMSMFVLLVLPRVLSALAKGWSPAHGVLMTAYMIQNFN